MDYPQFGASGGFTAASRARQLDIAELTTSRAVLDYVRSGSVSCSVTESLCHWGIEPDEHFGIIDSISLTIADEISPEYTANENNLNGDHTPKDLKIPITILQCCKIMRAHAILRVTGKGKVKIDLGSPGGFPSQMKTAIGTLDISSIVSEIVSRGPANDFIVISVDNNEDESSWATYTVTWKKTLYQEGGIASLVKAIDDVPDIPCDTDGLDFSFCPAYTIEYKLNSKDYARKTSTKTLHPMQS